MEDDNYELSLNSIQYSALETMDYDTDDTCQLGCGDNVNRNIRIYKQNGFLKQLYPPENKDPYSHMVQLEKRQGKQVSVSAYGTAYEKSIGRLPYKMHVAERYEAEYDYCMRWAADHMFRAGRIIPFQSNFYSVVKLSFIGRNWVLDCSNFKGQYDYSGWLPSLRKDEIENRNRNHAPPEPSVSNSSDEDYRPAAGRSLRSSETIYGVRSISSDQSNDSVLTKDPIDTKMYHVMGNSSNSSSLAPQHLKFNREMMTPASPVTEMGTPREMMDQVKSVTRSDSFEELFFDLIELDQLFTKQAKQVLNGDNDHPFPDLDTAKSFSDVGLGTLSEIEPDMGVMTETDTDSSEGSEKNKSKSMMSHLICFTGKKLSIRIPFSYLIDWIKSKKN